MEDTISLESGGLTLRFGVLSGQLCVQSLRGADGCEWAAGTGPTSPLWRIELLGTGDSLVSIADKHSELVVASADATEAVFEWDSPVADSVARVRMRVRCDSGSPLSYWSFEVDLPDGWKLSQADFPILPNIALRRGAKLAAPVGWGIESVLKPGFVYEGTYPGCLAAMQFVAFYAGGHGLYVGTHDPDANHKHYCVNAREDRIGFSCENYPGIPEHSGGTYKAPFEAVIGVFRGDYWDAARIYRDFTFSTPWGSAGQVRERTIPQWLVDTDLWLRPDGSPEANVEVTRRALDYFDVPTSLHWYRWHEIPYDTLYPEYFPPLEGFAEGISEFQRLGSHVTPYINGRLCDPNSVTWNDEWGSESAARDSEGQPYTELYGSQVPLNVMCPHTQQWQEKIAGLVERLVRECGVNGIYIDQIACAHAVRCFRKDHGHLPGGGDMWARGYRKMLQMVRERLPEDGIITSEENVECWIDQFDALLLVNTLNSPGEGQSIIPLFPAVYAGRTITYGFLYFPEDDLTRSLPFRFKMAQAFVFGSQLGWIQPWRIMRPDAAGEAEFLRNLARCRRFAHEFLTHGDFLGMVEVGGDNPRLSGQGAGILGGTYEIDTPAVIASAWSAPDGRLGIVVANMSDAPRRVIVALPLSKAGIEPAGPVSVEVFGSSGHVLTGVFRRPDSALVVPARDALLLAMCSSSPAPQ